MFGLSEQVGYQLRIVHGMPESRAYNQEVDEVLHSSWATSRHFIHWNSRRGHWKWCKLLHAFVL